MDLKQVVKDYIINNVLSHAMEEHHWRILIIDEVVASIITHLFTKTEIMGKDLLALLRIEEDAPAQPNYPVIYFIYLENISLKKVFDDIKSKKYQRFMLFYINDISDKMKKQIEQHEGLYAKKIPVNFHIVNSNVVVCDLHALKDLGDILDVKYNISYLDQKYENCVDFGIKQKIGDLIIIDRSNDLYTPLARFFTFLPICNDFGFIDNEFYTDKKFDFSKTEIFSTIKNLHLAECQTVLHDRAKLLNKEMNKIDKLNTKELMSLVLKAPETIQAKHELEYLLGILSDCFDKIESNNVNRSISLEQTVITKGNDYKNAINVFFDMLFDSKIPLKDKFRLYLLLIAAGYDFQNNEDNKLLDKGVLQKQDLKIKSKLKMLRGNIIKIPNVKSKYENDLYRPLVYHILQGFLSNKNVYGLQGHLNSKNKEMTSLRKSTFVFQDVQNKKNRKNIMLYIVGGISYEEICVANQIAKSNGIILCLGSDKILTFDAFVEDLRENN